MNEQQLLTLTKFWCDYVSSDHHKDRDCHFYINKVWSYGKEPIYRIEHSGYMSKLNDNEVYETYENALEALITWLEGEVKSAHRVPKDWQDQTKHDYNWAGVVDTLNHYKLHEVEYY